MKKSTKETLGAGLLLGSLILGVAVYRRSKGGTKGFTTGQLQHARYVRQWAKRAGKDISPKPVVAEKVLPNGMTQEYARKYVAWLNNRAKVHGSKYTHKHISPSSLALPVGEAVR